MIQPQILLERWFYMSLCLWFCKIWSEIEFAFLGLCWKFFVFLTNFEFWSVSIWNLWKNMFLPRLIDFHQFGALFGSSKFCKKKYPFFFPYNMFGKHVCSLDYAFFSFVFMTHCQTNSKWFSKILKNSRIMLKLFMGLSHVSQPFRLILGLWTYTIRY